MTSPNDPSGAAASTLFGGWSRDFAVSTAFLTRIPVRPVGGLAPASLAGASRAFPLVGLVVGLIAGGGLLAAAQLDLHPMACALVGLALAALVTGALHEDGLADVADGFGGGATRDAKLAIMRDSRIGAFGVVAVVFSVGIRAAVLGGLPGPGLAAASLVAAAVLSRAMLPMVMHRAPLARDDGLAAGAGRPDAETAWTALGLGGLGGLAFLGWWAGLIALLAAAAAAALLAWWARRQIAGISGDVLGAVQQAAETAAIIAAGAAVL